MTAIAYLIGGAFCLLLVVTIELCIRWERTYVVSEMFGFRRGRLIKLSNGEPVPHGEPLFILRGRDQLAAPTVAYYYGQARKLGVPRDRLDMIGATLGRFQEYARRLGVKMPGSTHGR